MNKTALFTAPFVLAAGALCTLIGNEPTKVQAAERSQYVIDMLNGRGMLDCQLGVLSSTDYVINGVSTAYVDLATGTPKRIDMARSICRSNGMDPGF